MKHKFLSMALVIMAGSLCMAGEIRCGDSLEAVIAVLGTPDGYIQTDNQTVLFYERGSVELEDGLVMSASLISPEAAEARRLERLRQEKLARQVAAKRAAEGLILRDLKMSDPSFLAQSASARLAYWQTFMRNYPGVPVGMDYEVAQRELQAEEAALRVEAERMRQYAELQERTALAEQRAVDAEMRARQSYTTFASYSYPVFYRPSHFVHAPRKPFCPPEPRRHKPEMKHGRGALPMYAHVGTSPNPRDHSPDGRLIPSGVRKSGPTALRPRFPSTRIEVIEPARRRGVH